MAEEGATHARLADAEMGLPLGHPESPPPEVHAQTVVAEPCPVSSGPEGLEEVAHAQPVAAAGSER
jgi:hypothetical protein